MELFDTIEQRRSIRKFTDRDVGEDEVRTLLDYARLCQSAKNRQPWKFMVLRGEDKDAVADIMLSPKNQDELPGYWNSSKHSALVIKNAPVLILVFRDVDEYWAISDLVSIGAAIEHICLGAVDFGLGSLWIRDTAYTEAEICAHLGAQNMELISAIAVGHPDESPFPRPRKALEEIMMDGRR